MDATTPWPCPSPPTCSLEDEVKQLIGLLDAYLFERGEIFITTNQDIFSYAPERPKCSLPGFSDVSPEQCLATYDEERLQSKQREALIASICLEPLVVDETHTTLNDEHNKLAPKYQISEFEKIEGLHEKLKQLRTKQQLAVDALNDDFLTLVATQVAEDANSDNTGELWTPSNATFSEFKRALEATMKRETRPHKALKGCGFTKGKWMFQILKGKGGANETLRELNELEYGYRNMRKAMVEGRLKILVWHELVWKASQEAKVKAKGRLRRNGIDLTWLIGDREDDFEEDELQGLADWVLQTADADLDGETEVERETKREIRAPSVEPMSDD